MGADVANVAGGAAARRAKQKAKMKASKKEANAEMPSEQRPRGQGVWLKERQQATQLAKVGVEDGEKLSQAIEQIGEDKPIGKKTRKKLQVLALKQARKEQKKKEELVKQHTAAATALTGKAKFKEGRVKAAARDLLGKLKVRTPQTEQRLLASVAERIASKPEDELELFDVFFELHASGVDRCTKQLALLSAVAVFRDLVPSYRIREDRDKVAESKTKTTLALEKHEMTILHTYRKLLPLLEAALKEDARAFAPALSALVKAASDFNYRQRLINVAVRHANSPYEQVRRSVGDGLQDMLKSDYRLEASKELVLAIGHLAQQAASGRGGKAMIQPDLLHILLRLPVGGADEAELQGDLRGVDDNELRRDLQEGSIRQGADKLRKGEAELLYEVFVVYLRILRQRGVHCKELIASALAGIAKWGHQVNLELLLEILSELKWTVQEAIVQMDELVSMQGLYCALELLSGPAKALITDATWIPDALTGALRIALPALYSTHSEGSRGWPPHGVYMLDDGEIKVHKKELALSLEEGSAPCLVLRCLDSAMKCSHGFGGASDGSMAALLEQLGLLAVDCDSFVSVALLKEMAGLLKKNRKLHTLLDIEGGLFGLGGITDRALSVAWPLHALSASLAPWPAKVGRLLADTVSSRRGLLSDIFPSRDSKAWLESEFLVHVAGLLELPKPALLGQVDAPAESEEQQQQAKEQEEDEGDDEEDEEGKSKGAAWGRSTPASGAISRKKRRRTVFWSESQLRKAFRLDAV